MPRYRVSTFIRYSPNGLIVAGQVVCWFADFVTGNLYSGIRPRSHSASMSLNKFDNCRFVPLKRCGVPQVPRWIPFFRQGSNSSAVLRKLFTPLTQIRLDPLTQLKAGLLFRDAFGRPANVSRNPTRKWN